MYWKHWKVECDWRSEVKYKYLRTDLRYIALCKSTTVHRLSPFWSTMSSHMLIALNFIWQLLRVSAQRTCSPCQPSVTVNLIWTNQSDNWTGVAKHKARLFWFMCLHRGPPWVKHLRPIGWLSALKDEFLNRSKNFMLNFCFSSRHWTGGHIHEQKLHQRLHFMIDSARHLCIGLYNTSHCNC